MALGRAPTYPQVNVHAFGVIKAILFICWKTLCYMYIERSCNFYLISNSQSRVIKKFYDLRDNLRTYMLINIERVSEHSVFIRGLRVVTMW